MNFFKWLMGIMFAIALFFFLLISRLMEKWSMEALYTGLVLAAFYGALTGIVEILWRRYNRRL